ncbi:hypothetical protein SUGI_0985000 [Cryptomeria japonica]|nr:hypothetical protein SUGI_0985000 [Cryptomeria japonica]
MNEAAGQILEIGSALLPDDTANRSFVISENGTFAFGFYSTSPNTYAVGIWYNQIKDKYVVWRATSTSIPAGSNASLQLAESGGLLLRDNSGALVWTTNTTANSVTFGQILDTGNFVLTNNASNIVWSTFDNPADTLLPGQILTAKARLRNTRIPSRYSLGIQNMGTESVLALFWNETKIYKNLTVGSSINSTVLDSTGRFAVRNASGQTIASWLSSDYTDSSSSIRRITLDGDGNLRIHRWAADAGDWAVGWQALEDECRVNGLCGEYGLCKYIEGKRTCVCPPGFVQSSQAENWTSQGCKRLAPLDCPAPQVISLANTVFFWDGTDFIVGNATSESDCMAAVRQTPAMTAATFPNNGSGMCIQKRVSFVSGYESPSSRSVSFIRICGEAVQPLEPPGSNEFVCSASDRRVLRGFVSASASLNLILFISLLVCWRLLYQQRRKGVDVQPYPLLFNFAGSPLSFSFQALQEATDNFSVKLGSGGFGSVYKGVLATTNMPVAVKKLEDLEEYEQGDKEFSSEVGFMGRTHHFNLIRLLGFCSEGAHRLLVYELMPCGSLDRYIFKTGEERPPLNWKTRVNIALGAAKGIAYLHEECSEPIAHCDIKPQNILLDSNFQPKVSDFGLSKIIGRSRHIQYQSITLRGSPGYMAPEWLADVPITCKADVFSFGILLLEIVGGRTNVDLLSVDEDKRVYSAWAYGMAKEGKYVDVVDEEIRDGSEIDEVQRLLQVAFWCIQENPHLRPTMGKVVRMLEGTFPLEGLPSSIHTQCFPHMSSEISSSRQQMNEIREVQGVYVESLSE